MFVSCGPFLVYGFGLGGRTFRGDQHLKIYRLNLELGLDIRCLVGHEIDHFREWREADVGNRECVTAWVEAIDEKLALNVRHEASAHRFQGDLSALKHSTGTVRHRSGNSALALLRPNRRGPKAAKYNN